MKLNSTVSLKNVSLQHKVNDKKNVNFKGIGRALGDLNKFAMQRIEKGGFFAEFVILDMCGLVLPRVYQGFQRNKKELGHLNYQAGTEEFLREFITGPSLFLIPLGAVALAGKALGKGVQINSNTLKKFTQVFKKLGNDITKSDLFQNQRNFASKLFDDLFTNNPNKLKDAVPATVKSLDEYKNSFVELLINSIGKKGSENQGKFADLISDINASYFNKKNTYAVDIVLKDKQHGTSAVDLFDDAKKYMEDVIPSVKMTVSEALEKGVNVAKEFVDSSIDKITKIRENGRRVLCLGGSAALAGFLSIIPKIYQRSKTNPALNGLVEQNNGKDVKKC